MQARNNRRLIITTRALGTYGSPFLSVPTARPSRRSAAARVEYARKLYNFTISSFLHVSHLITYKVDSSMSGVDRPDCVLSHNIAANWSAFLFVKRVVSPTVLVFPRRPKYSYETRRRRRTS
ncbi:hypothetical protein EVAR_97752_1 [Eumeta japonica]|uniref:Uncharacterized protein n=1 Tax=Eumeta variegata TaxID=151549 RepID=A0A4C1X875_EUMVA|nr:hypothetical protein EVAR_97752_1 [Eumeta japonica]